MYDFKVGEFKTRYLFQEGGEYTIKLFVMDPEGLESTIEKTLNVEEPTKLLDLRDGKIYNFIIVGDLKYLSENYAFESDESHWYNDSVKYENNGRYYSRDDAIKNAPKGWRLPTSDESSLLIEHTTNMEYTAGYELKKPGEWVGGTGSDPLGFSAIPAGYLMFESAENRYVSGNLSVRAIFWSYNEGAANCTYYSLVAGSDWLYLEESEPLYVAIYKFSVRYVRKAGTSY